MQEFRDLKVWQKSHEVALAVYRATEAFPRVESYGLTSQMRRAAVSIPSNICEGCGRGSLLELIQFCQTSFGSATELEYQLLLARDLTYLNEATYRELSAAILEVKRMLGALLTTLRERAGRARTRGLKAYQRNDRQTSDEKTDTLTH